MPQYAALSDSWLVRLNADATVFLKLLESDLAIVHVGLDVRGNCGLPKNSTNNI